MSPFVSVPMYIVSAKCSDKNLDDQIKSSISRIFMQLYAYVMLFVVEKSRV